MRRSRSGGLLLWASGGTSLSRQRSGSLGSFPFSRFAFLFFFSRRGDMARFDVAVVGAGPAGSSAAISLARKGYSVVLLERAVFPREKLCGDFLNPANWPLLEQLGLVDEILSLEHEKVTAFRISTFSGAEAAVSFPFRNGQTLFGLGLRRSFLDDILLRSAQREGVQVRQACKVGSLA